MQTGRLVLFNPRFVEMYDLPPDKMKVGCTLRDILQLRKEAGTFKGDPDKYVAKWVDEKRSFPRRSRQQQVYPGWN